MSFRWLRRIIAFLTVAAAAAAQAQQPPFSPAQLQEKVQAWQQVQPRESGLVIIIDSDALSSVTVSDEKQKALNFAKWAPGLPFIRQYKLEPGTYQLRLTAEPISTIGVNAKEGSLTYVRFAPFRPSTGIIGSRITGWAGPATSDIAGLLTQAFSKGLDDAFATPHIDVPAKILYVNTTPPWPIPPPPRG
jgi:hypothetical protein